MHPVKNTNPHRPRGTLMPHPDALARRPGWARELTMARLAAGVTQAALSDQLGVCQGNYARYETGEHQPRAARMAAIRAAIANLSGEVEA